MKTTTVAFLIILTFAVLYSACKTSQKVPSLKSQYSDIYIQQFKLTYLRKLLIKSYNNSTAVQEIIKLDHSGFTEPVLTEKDYMIIDSVTFLDNQIMIIDSSKGSHRAEGAKGKRPLDYIIKKLDSKWLDSLAKARLKESGIPISWQD